MKKILAIFCFLLLVFPWPALAQTEAGYAGAVNYYEETLEGEVKGVFERAGGPGSYELEVLITQGCLKGKTIEIDYDYSLQANQLQVEKGDQVVVSYSRDAQGNEFFYLTDFVRRPALLWLLIIFVVVTLLVAHWRGATSLLGMAISFLVIFKVLLPQISVGKDPVMVAILSSLLIAPVTFYLSHGVSKKTTLALGATILTLAITAVLANFFINVARLTGFASEEAAFLHFAKGEVVNIRGLILAGIIIGALGVLDDITVAQAGVVEQLKIANPKLKTNEIYLRAMKIGRDHIASMVNTLILVYTGAALPLLLLFIDNPIPFSRVINYEILAEEIVRTLVGSIGLVLAVPITTFLAARVKIVKKR